MLRYTCSIELLRVMVAIVLDYINLFEILRSIDIVESYMYGCHAFCLGPRMLEGQNRVPGEYIQEH